MKNLGKILLFALLIPHVAFAGVKASVDSNEVELGEMVTYTLEVTGENIARPNIRTLCNTDVISTSSQTSIQIVNSNYQKSYQLSYKFIPQENCIIEPIEIEIDGKIEKSNSVELKVNPVTKSSDADFMLELKTDKKELFVGEPFKLTLLLKQKKGSQAIDNEFIAPKLKGFWIKNETQPITTENDKYIITKVIYTMTPQRVGLLKIQKAKIRIATRSHRRDSWGGWVPQIKWRTYFSNDLELDVRDIPAGVDLVGEFEIQASVDKTQANANEAVNVVITIKGDGNLEDVKPFKPYIDGVSVFDEKVHIKGSTLTQKIAFVGDRDFTIPSFKIKSFNPKTKEIKTTSTKEIHVKIKNAKAEEKLTIKKQEPIQKEQITHKAKEEPRQVYAKTQEQIPLLWIVTTFIAGVVLGLLLALYKPWKIFNKEKSFSVKDEKMLLIKLLPYKDDEEVKELIDTLEKNAYSDEKLYVDKKLLKKVVKKYLDS